MTSRILPRSSLALFGERTFTQMRIAAVRRKDYNEMAMINHRRAAPSANLTLRARPNH
jgi:hypothetical protein